MSDAGVRNPELDRGDPNEDEIDVEIRSSLEIRSRILILAAVLRRLALEAAAQENDTEPLADAFDEREWLREQGLSEDLTPGEATLLDSPPGSVASEVITETSWQGEALVALGWAVRALDMPPAGMTVDIHSLIESVPRPWDDIQHWFDNPAIVSEQEAIREREIADIWRWRATTEVLRRRGTTADSQEYEEAIREVVAEARAAGLVNALRGEDFGVDGASIKELSTSDLDQLIAVTAQRLHALNWLCGFGASWDLVPLDV